MGFKLHNLTISFLVFSFTINASMTAFGEETASDIKGTPTIDCSSKPFFAENTCDVCFGGGEIAPEQGTVQGTSDPALSIKLKAVELNWKNELEGINQNFYESVQDEAQIKTNIGTPPTTLDTTSFSWGENVEWKDLDGLKLFSLDAGKETMIKTIENDTQVILTSPKQETNPYFLVKIPISYFELKMGTFKESEKKTSNYCVAYTPKGGTTTPPKDNPPADNNNTNSNNNSNNNSNQNANNTTNNDSTTNTNINSSTNNNPNTNTNGNTNTNANTNSNTNSNANSNSNNSASNNTTKSTNTPSKPVTNTQNIPTYNAKVDLNAAPPDPKVVAATQVETGPSENILILLAAILLSVLFLPKVNRIFNQG